MFYKFTAARRLSHIAGATAMILVLLCSGLCISSVPASSQPSPLKANDPSEKKSDPKPSAEAFREPAEHGDPTAQYNLAGCYLRGVGGVAEDAVQAANWFRKVAENTDPKLRAFAQIILGVMYMAGVNGIPTDQKLADSFFRAASPAWETIRQNRELAKTAFGIGAFYLTFSNAASPQIPDATMQALSWYQRAADTGNSEAITIAEALRAKIRATQQVANRDSNDVIAAVLNFSAFGDDDGTNGRFWYRDPASKCRYLLHRDGTATNDDAFELLRSQLGQGNTAIGRREIDLDSLDPKNITFRFDGATTVTMHVNQPLFIYVGQLDIQRLERGWTLIYTAHCTGKPKPF